MRNVFLEPLSKVKNVHLIVGNHDIYHKDNNDTNSLSELLKGYNFNFYTNPVEINGSLLIPWITPENAERSLAAIKNTKAKMCFGHFEINGFDVIKGVTCEHGLLAKIFAKFDLVASGHFHIRSRKDNIQYIGSPYEMTWNDYDTPKGFCVFDTETNQLEFIQNKNTIFEKIYYKDDINTLNVKEKYVKVIVQSKQTNIKFEKYIDELESFGPADLKIIEEINTETIDDIIDETESTDTILRKYIDNLDVELDKKKLQSLFVELYNEALIEGC